MSVLLVFFSFIHNKTVNNAQCVPKDKTRQSVTCISQDTKHRYDKTIYKVYMHETKHKYDKAIYKMYNNTK